MTTSLTVFLVICILLACAFEFINGFHDTANAVATVIYNNSLKPTTAVVYSGIMNFVGVLTGGIGVAMGIVNLLPMEVLVDNNVYHGIAMIMALLLSSIIWNLGTWLLGLPASSSHTLIGSILGIGLAFYFIPGYDGNNTVNWAKAKETGWALLLSPFAGFAMAIVIMFVFKRIVKNNIFYKEPIPGKRPPIWIRMLSWCTCGMVSFFHGQNDGQKGVGVVMMILIAIMPAYYAVDKGVNLQSINANIATIEKIISATDTTQFGKEEYKDFSTIKTHVKHFATTISNHTHADEVAIDKRFDLRSDVMQVLKSTDKLLNSNNLAISKNNATLVRNEIAASKKLVEYAPRWVIIMISICLGLGTMIGWKRIVRTLGEKIGKQHMSYAQGASAEIVTAIGIGVATGYKVPVSTTHILSSSIMGSMVAKKGLKNLQRKTILNIFMAWVLTLPVTIILSGALFLLFRTLL